MTKRSNRKQLALGVCVVFATSMALAEPAESAETRPAAKSTHSHSAARHARGNYTQTTQTQRTANGHTSNTVRTDAQGRTSTRDATVTNNRETGTRTKDVTYTGRDGEVRTSDTDDPTHRRRPHDQHADNGRTRPHHHARRRRLARPRDAHHDEDRDGRSRPGAVAVWVGWSFE